MLRRPYTFFLFTLLILSHILFSYFYFGGWWHSSIGTAILLVLSYFIWKRDFLARTGLKINARVILKTFVLSAIIILGSLLMMKYLSQKNDIQIQITNWRDYYHDVFYILNEEIILGPVLLFALIRGIRMNPFVAGIVLAVMFSIIHFVFYKWVFNDRGALNITTLTSLFLVGFVRNSLILKTGHIGYSWALHFGWIAVMFGSMHTYIGTGNRVTELERFNFYLGSVEMLIISIVLAGLTLIFWLKKTKTKANV